jgi:dTMP kinase
MKPVLKKGILLAIEGIDGAGKTTQTNLVAEELRRRGFEVVTSKEPTDGKWGKMIRNTAKTGRLSPEAELNAFIEDRKEHVRELILPNLAQRKIVIVDRYYFSTAAYQGARGMDPSSLIKQNESFAPEPDLLVLLDIDPSVGVMRVSKRGEANLFETHALLAKSSRIFQELNKKYLLKIDATGSTQEIRDKIVHNVLATAVKHYADDKSLSPQDAINATRQVYGYEPITTA